MCPLPVYNKNLFGGKARQWHELKPQFSSGWTTIVQALGQTPEVVRLFHAGNFIIEEEVPLETQKAMIRFICQHPEVRQIEIESKPEYVTPQRLDLLCELIPPQVTLQVNMGVEIYDPEIRLGVLHKGYSDEDLERAITILAERNIARYAYVIIQPPGVSPVEAIPKTVETVKWLTKLDPEIEISLISFYLEKGTTANKLVRQKIATPITPPTVKVVVQAILASIAAHPKKKINFGGFEDEIKALAIAHGCIICMQPMMDAANAYKYHCDGAKLAEAVAQIPSCSC